MRWAIACNERSLPSPGLVGSCPTCGEPVIARCGTQRVHHWAHRGKRSCDRWWEPETEWHRGWKQEFPEEWQEVPLPSETGERHIADVRTSQGLTIEFQHSHLQPQERAARESFYGAIVWVVDGLRLSRDFARFQKGTRDLRAIANGVYVHRWPEEIFPRSWLISNAPVFFDFGSGTSAADNWPLWCLLPQRVRGHAVVMKVSREQFVRVAREQSMLLLGRSILAIVSERLAIEQRRVLAAQLRAMAAHRRSRRPPRSSGRRWSRRWRPQMGADARTNVEAQVPVPENPKI